MAATNQFGNLNWIRGMQSINHKPEDVTMTPKSTSSTLALFPNSPIVVIAGLATSAGSTDSTNITGSVIALLDANYDRVSNLSTTAAGYVIHTCSPTILFEASIDSTIYAETDIGKYYCFEASEGGTVGTGLIDPGTSFSTRGLGTESSTVGQVQVVRRVLTERNASGVSPTRVIVAIKNFSRGAAS